MYNHLRQTYLETEVLAASPVKLVELLYRGTITAIDNARAALRNGDIAERSRQIDKAVAIINHLALTLDHSKGAPISVPLAELYDYLARRLLTANVQQVEEPLAEVSALLKSLQEAWQACSPAPPLAPPIQSGERVACSL
jgi:flagellar protein FliS